MTERIRVLIVDDQRLLCEGFRKLIELEPQLEVVGMAGDGEEALALTEQLALAHTAPDVVLMDVRMPRLDGITATRAFKERWPAIRVVILTTFDDRELIQAGLQAGALGYVLKDITAEQLATTIRVVAQGQVLLHPDVASKVIAGFSSAPIEPAEIAPLTPGVHRRQRPDAVDRARAGGSGLTGAGRVQSRDQRDALHRQRHRQEPSQQHPGQAGGARPDAGGTQSQRTRLAVEQHWAHGALPCIASKRLT